MSLVVGNRATQETFLKARFVIFRCQKYVKKGYMEMTKKFTLSLLKSVLGRSVSHYSKTILGRKRLRNKILKNRSPENKFTYNQQINFCISLIEPE